MKKIRYFVISLIGILGLSFGLSGCAKSLVDIKPIDVSQSVRNEHQNFSCSQLEQKYAFLDEKFRSYNTQANMDRKYKTNGEILWRELFGSNKDNEKAYAQLLGLKEYLQELMIHKNCNLEQDKFKIKKEIIINNQDIY